MLDEPATRRQYFFRNFKRGLQRNGREMAIFVILVSALAAIVIAINGNSKAQAQQVILARLIQCQNDYNSQNNTRTRALSEAAEAEAQASEKVDIAFRNVMELTVDPAAAKDKDLVRSRLADLKIALDKQAEARNKTTQERIANPVPPPPNAYCGGVDPTSIK